MISVVAAIFIVLMILGTPLVFVLGISGLSWIYILNDEGLLPLVSQRVFSGMFSYPLLSVPFFILAGELMNAAGITDRLVKFADLLVGRFRGGMAHVNIVSSFLFAGISGSAVADTAAIGSILIPTMRKSGYDVDFSVAVTATSSVIGPIVPPSIIMVIYAYSASVSVGGMFAAGFVPGLLICLGLMTVAYIISRRRNYLATPKELGKDEKFSVVKDALVALVMPLIIIGGILSGVFTATEASAVAVGYALLVGAFFLHTLKLRTLPALLVKTALSTSMVLLVIGTASIFSWLLASEEVPIYMTEFFTNLTNNRYILIFFINIFLLFVGMFLDTSAAIIILAPILSPFAVAIGFHPLHFGLIMVVNLVIGLATPPLGLCLFVGCSISDRTLDQIVKPIIPFILVEVIVLFIITYFPDLSMFLPRILGYY
jgi:C4-dicarboxylate transporter DctM subunit